MNKISVIALVCLCFLFGSCEKWFDVAPKSSVKKDKLLETEDGFLSVLDGVYINMFDNSLYGRELSFGFLDVLAQYYDNIASMPTHVYSYAAKYDYENADVSGLIEGIWEKMYACIANLNIILGDIDSKKDVFSGNNYGDIKGQALALRALLHFDLLRLFAPAYTTATSKTIAIPYVDKITNTVIPFSSIETVFAKIEADLKEARQLLKNFDPMGPVEASETVQSSTNPVVVRRMRMNYYGVTTLLARLKLHEKKHSEALNYISELETDHAKLKLKWANLTSFTMLYQDYETLFGLRFIQKSMTERSKVYFDIQTAKNTDILKISLNKAKRVYETDVYGSGDFRFSKWMSKTDDNTITRYQNGSSATQIVLIHRSEIYLIKAECLAALDDHTGAIGALNVIHANRGLTPLPEHADVADEIVKSYRKEYVAMGQLFFFYKRMGFESVEGWGTSLGDKEYVLPVPQNELSHNF